MRFIPKWLLTENQRVDANLNYFDSPNWLIWTAGSQVATFRRHELDSSLNLNWYPTSKQELRFKLQWIGLGPEALQPYVLPPVVTPAPAGGFPSDFTSSPLGVQGRYRFKFHPLSDLFVCYGRAGDGPLPDP